MFKSHLMRVSKNKLSISIFLIMVLIPAWDALLIYTEFKRVGGDLLHPAHAFFLSGSSIGHIPQYILLWFLPLFLLLLGTEDSLQDFETGYANILMGKVGKKYYYIEKMLFSFFIGFFAMALSLFFNFLLVSILFRNGTYTKGLSDVSFNDSFTDFVMQNPYAGLAIFSLIASLLAGFAGLIGASSSLFFKDRKYAYASAFFLWFIFILQDNSSMYVFQPFSEYGLKEIVPVFLVLSISYVFLSGLVYFFEVKKNEAA